ncbi:N-alpha-acetyltransferase 35, NatC auxiliary subunit [Colletotrichum orbiculare MAFF 240422]|uniref:N-alpha-acetyltransferase 35, NatC auxiliary subunit n=1 Tax=Colletotrichum orbiculare (strain 104-T / ATCC 96160 / CBS 514.97 / LARS 414 / MAFF 240422) TaxID=1213857 RepID=N4VIQ9_COLOR|nr:N-alpha-acetyltransferase 35, NatC auxiliary subunit [Colletotrichum orbiculare MAFF 240422]
MAVPLGFGIPDDISRLSLEQGREPPPPPPPNVSNNGIVAFDITSKFIAAAKQLSPGELVKDGFFTLFESVGALDIMDPKMDSGCLEPGDSLDVDYDVSRPLLPEEVLGIIDQLLCHEMAWHIGYPLSQTVLTSVYVESILMPDPATLDEAHFIRSANGTPPSPMHAVLRAYCLGLLKTCGDVNERIKNEHYYEEEDFVTNTYNRVLLDDFDVEDVRDVIKDASFVLRQLGDSVSQDLIEALNARLLLRYTFLAAIDHTQYRTEPDRIRSPWKEAHDLLPRIKSSHALGRPVPEACSAKLQRKLASTMPPRPIVQTSFDDAFANLTRLISDGIEVVGVLNYTDPICLQTFVSTFQAKKPQPLIFVRTLLQSFLFKDMEVLGHKSIRQLLDDDFCIVSLPDSILLDRANDDIEATHDPRFAVAEHMESFRQRAAQPYLDILRTFCQNRCRVRRTLCHIVRDWENLQFDAEDLDQVLQHLVGERPVVYQSAAGPVETYSLPLSSWAYLYKVKQMEWIVQLGFELEVYQPDELAGMYWYLNYLAKNRVQHVERIKTFVVQAMKNAQKQQQQQQPQHRLTPAAEAQYTRTLNFIRLSLLDAAVTDSLADALSCLYTVLIRLGLVKPPPRPYGTDELRYELRMRPFAAIGLPSLPTFEEFSIGSRQSDASVPELLDLADRAIAGAKRGSEVMSKFPENEAFSVGSHDRWVQTIKNGLKSCIATGLAVSMVRKALEKNGGGEGGDLQIRAEVPTPDKSYHEWWIVPRIVPVR